MSAYVDLDDLKATLNLAGTSFADDDSDSAIACASNGIDFLLGRSFTLSEQEETRLFACEHADMAPIDDLNTLASLLVDRDGDGTYEETWVEGTQFRLEPLNAPNHSAPWTHVRALAGYQLPTLPLSTVRVTGLFGWENPPEGIVEATKIVAAKMIIRKKSAPLGIVMSQEFAVRIARFDPDVQFAIAPYNRRPAVASLRLG